MRYIKIISFLILVLTIGSCSSSGELSMIENQIESSNIYSWVNLMPGGDPKFHITGDLVFKENSDFDINESKLEAVKIYQNDRMIFLIKPNVKIEIKPDYENKFDLIFSSLYGYELVPDFNYNNLIDVELIFKEDGESYSYIVKNNKVDKVY